MASVGFIQIAFFVPIMWILMIFNILAFSAKSFIASLLGLITPYWFAAGLWLFETKSFSRLTNMFSIQFPTLEWFNFSFSNLQQTLVLGYIIFLFIIGSIHFLIDSIRDKIRVRQLYYAFMLMSAYALVLLLLLPQEYDMLIRVMTIAVSPLIGHFFALTHSKLSNILFFFLTISLLAITGFNLWMSLSLF